MDTLETFLALPVGALRGMDAAIPFKWPLAKTYVVSGDEIHPNTFKEDSLPLDDPDLFSSLASLYENGEPSDETVVRWVEKHGLFTMWNTEKAWLGDPLTLKEFKDEAREAHTALNLFNDLSLGKPEMVRAWLVGRRPQTFDGDDNPKGPNPRSRYANLHMYTDENDELDARHVEVYGQKRTDDKVLSVGLSALQERVREKIDLEVRFVPNFEHPRPLGGAYRPVPVLMPRNLLSAAWLQFCVYVADFDRDWRLCVACGRPFEVSRADRTTCRRPGCQKKRQRLEKTR